MKKVFISITGVLRDTYSKVASEYRKYYIESELEEGQEEDFVYDMVLPVTTNDLSYHFKFQDKDEMNYFFFIEFAMEIFGHSAPVYSGVFKDLSDLIKSNEDWEVTIVSDELGKGKPASLFFLSKNSCYVDNYKFFKKDNVGNMWNDCDLWITTDEYILSSKPDNKKSIKVDTEYNKEVSSDYTVEKLLDINELEL